MSFRTFLHKLASGLEKDDVRQLGFLTADVLRNPSFGSWEALDKKRNGALLLLDDLQKEHHISPENTDYLVELLTRIHRIDLVEQVQRFSRNEDMCESKESLKQVSESKIRDTEMNSLLRHFYKSSHEGMLAALISGFAGVGKTTLALAFYQKMCRDNSHLNIQLKVVDFRASDLCSSEAVYFALMRTFDEFYNSQEMNIDRLTILMRKHRAHTVLLLDNVDLLLEPSNSNSSRNGFLQLLKAVLDAQNSNIQMLITSRYSLNNSELDSFGGKVLALKLNVMECTDSLSLIRHYSAASSLSEEDGRAIATACGHHPLAMRLAVRCVGHVPIDVLLKQLQRQPVEVMNLVEMEGHEAAFSVQNGLKTSFLSLPSDLQSLLLQLSVIPESFDIQTAYEVCGSLPIEKIEDKLFRLTLRSMVDPILHQETKKVIRYQIHLLVGAFLQAFVSLQSTCHEIKIAFTRAKENFSQYMMKKLLHLSKLANMDQEKAVGESETDRGNILHFLRNDPLAPSDRFNLINYCNYLPVMHILMPSSLRFQYFQQRYSDSRYAKNAGSEIFFGVWFASHLTLLNRSSEAALVLDHCKILLNNFEKEKESCKKVANHLRAHFLYMLGLTHICRPSPTERNIQCGVEMLDEALKIFQKLPECKIFLEPRINNDIGSAFSDLARLIPAHKGEIFHKALIYFKKTKKLHLKNNKRGVNFDLITTFQNIGMCYHELRMEQEALNWYQKALNLEKSCSIKDVETRCAILYNIGVLLFQTFQYPDANANLSECFRLRKDYFGCHPLTATAAFMRGRNMKNFARCNNSFQLAWRYFQTALKIEEKLMRQGRDSSSTWQFLKQDILELSKVIENQSVADIKMKFDEIEEAQKVQKQELENSLCENQNSIVSIDFRLEDQISSDDECIDIYKTDKEDEIARLNTKLLDLQLESDNLLPPDLARLLANQVEDLLKQAYTASSQEAETMQPDIDIMLVELNLCLARNDYCRLPVESRQQIIAQLKHVRQTLTEFVQRC